jgi:hypothetical protein
VGPALKLEEFRPRGKGQGQANFLIDSESRLLAVELVDAGESPTIDFTVDARRGFSFDVTIPMSPSARERLRGVEKAPDRSGRGELGWAWCLALAKKGPSPMAAGKGTEGDGEGPTPSRCQAAKSQVNSIFDQGSTTLPPGVKGIVTEWGGGRERKKAEADRRELERRKGK